MDVLQVLRPLEQLERKLGGLYEWFSGLFEADREAAFVFWRLHLDENSHVRLIEYQRRLARGNPAAFADVDVSLDALQAAIARVEGIRGGAAVPTVEEAVRTALELESRAAEYHYSNAVQQASPEMKRLFDSLGVGDEQHVTCLRDLAARRGWA
jgi:hypothetical protein